MGIRLVISDTGLELVGKAVVETEDMVMLERPFRIIYITGQMGAQPAMIPLDANCALQGVPRTVEFLRENILICEPPKAELEQAYIRSTTGIFVGVNGNG